MTNTEIRTAIEHELDKAEDTWDQVKDHLIKGERTFSMMNESRIPSKIPGHPLVDPQKAEVADFIAFVLDTRSSTKRLLQALAGAKVNFLERVLYETTALNTAGIIIIEEYNGGVTELLGDGFLALFKVEDDVKKQGVYDAHNAAKKCLDVNQAIINDILKKRYALPPLHIGIGMAYSQAIVTVFGTGENQHPKALGECVYRATKLSCGYNEIHIDTALKNFWPTKTGGTLSFQWREKLRGEQGGYTITKTS